MSISTHSSSFLIRKVCRSCVFFSSILICVVILYSTSNADAQYHYCSWNRFTLHVPLAKQWSTDAEIQARWQSGAGGKNMFGEQLLLSYRHWVYYKPDNRFRFSFSPFSYFSANPYIMKPGDEKLNAISEYRITLAVEVQEKLLPKLWINGRVGAEYRMHEHTANNWRSRYRVGSRYDINKKYSITGNYELLFATHVATTYTHLDNERIWAMMGRNITDKLKAEIGLMHLSRKMNGNQSIVKEGDMLLSVTYSI